MAPTDSVDSGRSGLLSKETLEKYSQVNADKKLYMLDLKLPEAELKTLKKLAEKQGLSLNGAVQRAIANEVFLRAEIEAGNTIIVEVKNGKPYQLTFKE
jgi:hypothetical protein